MKGVIAGLFVFMMMLSFAVAQSSSSIRSDFYIQEPGMTGGYEEDVVADVADDSTENIWLSKVIYWGVIVVAVLILLKVLKGMTGSSKPKVSKKRKAKRSKRKKK